MPVQLSPPCSPSPRPSRSLAFASTAFLGSLPSPASSSSPRNAGCHANSSICTLGAARTGEDEVAEVV